MNVRCEALYSQDYLQTLKQIGRSKEIQCSRIAEYVVENKCLCRVHAGMALLKIAQKIEK